MKKRLYIDFDGVILDTITVSYAMLKVRNIDWKDIVKTKKFYQELDWDKLLKESNPIGNSIQILRELSNGNKYEVSILTHVVNEKEKFAKEKYISKYLEDIPVIYVDKNIAKCDVVEAKDAILVDDFMGNLKLWQEKGGIPVKFSTTSKKYDIISIHNLAELNSRYDEIIKFNMEKLKNNAC